MMPVQDHGVERVLLVHDYAGARGGAELVMLDLRHGLRQLGVDARLLTSDADPVAPGDHPDFLFHGITGRGRALRETINPSAVRAVRQAIRAFSPQAVHLGMFLTQASPAILPLLATTTTVWMPNEHRATCPSGTRWLPRLARCEHVPGRACLTEGCMTVQGLAPRLVQLALLGRWRSAIDLVVPPSQAMAESLRAFGWRVEEIIPHPVRLPAVPAVGREPGLLAYAGRLVPGKGVEVLLEAMRRMPRSCRLRVVGDGPERARHEALAHRLDLGDRAEFLGHVSRTEVQSLLAPAEVQVVPSTWNEPFGLVAIEAMARGTVVVGSDIGGLRDLIAHGHNGFLVPPGDPDALATRLSTVLGDPKGLDAVREAARSTVASWTPEVIAKRFLRLYARRTTREVA